MEVWEELWGYLSSHGQQEGQLHKEMEISAGDLCDPEGTVLYELTWRWSLGLQMEKSIFISSVH